MIDHISLGVSDLKRSTAFYTAVLEPLGLVQIVATETRVGFGKRYPELWLNLRSGMPRVADETGAHVCLRARTKNAVDRFHAAALANGGSDEGTPRDRQATMTTYYAGFVRDPDGNRLEAASFPAAAG
jgi:catechol 2,3-dioxygenase-like lactoylglutathione lyase family enzyme